MIVAHDKQWQFPVITEKHAFLKANEFLEGFEHTVYFGFPWATLIDLLVNQKNEAEELLESLKQLGERFSGASNVVTVCQHIAIKRYARLFESVGITHIFWSHAVKNECHFPDYENIEILPFPLYPVHILSDSEKNAPRQYLFSFVGANSNQWYLTDIRELLIKQLAAEKQGLIVERENWHFNKIVYEHQIHHIAASPAKLLDTDAENSFQNALKHSVFSLCPSGTGPNSIRLWESLGSGVIPVILSETYLPPGNQDLWKEACIFCGENLDEIKTLVQRLEEVNANKELITAKLAAGKQLWSLYGIDFFIHDIVKLFLRLEQTENPGYSAIQSNMMAELLAKVIDGKTLSADETRFCVLNFVSRVLLDPAPQQRMLENDERFHLAIKKVLKECDEVTQRHAVEVFQHRRITELSVIDI